MLGSSIILLLSICAFAFNARYDSSYGYSNGGSAYSSLSPSIAHTSTSSPKPSRIPSAPVYGHSASVIPYPTSKNSTEHNASPTETPSCAPYWMENIRHQGLASFNPDPGSYRVFRNVKDFGARG